MFNTISMTGTGMIIALLAFGLPYIGINLDQNTITQFVDAVAQVISIILMAWGQIRRPDLVGGIVRK